MTSQIKKRRRLRRVLIPGLVCGGLFAYRQYRLSNATDPAPERS